MSWKIDPINTMLAKHIVEVHNSNPEMAKAIIKMQDIIDEIYG